MSAVDRAWQRMKEEAHKCAFDGRRINRFESEAIVTHLMHECRVDPFPEIETIQFFGRELMRMIEGCRPVDDEAAIS